MRLRSTQVTSRADDSGADVLEEDSKTLGWSAPGRLDVFHQGAVYAADGFDLATGTIPAGWADSGSWPSYPVGVLGETQLILSAASRTQTQGMERRHTLACADVSPSGDWPRRRHRVQVTAGGVWVLREECLWWFDFAMDEVFAWAGPGQTVPSAGSRTPGVYAETPLDSGELLASYDPQPLVAMAYGVWATGEVLWIATAGAIEVLYRAPDGVAFTRPWSASPLTAAVVGGNASDTIEDIAVSPEGYVFVLLSGPEGLKVSRTISVFSPERAVTTSSGHMLDTSLLAVLPVVLAEAAAWSQLGADATTQISPQLRFGGDRALYVHTARALIRLPRPLDDLTEWDVWAGIEGDAWGITPRGPLLPANGQLADLAFSGGLPGVLWRADTDAAVLPDGVLYIFDQAFRAAHYRQHYDADARALAVHVPLFPRSTVVQLGKTLSPPEGEDIDPEIGGTS